MTEPDLTDIEATRRARFDDWRQVLDWEEEHLTWTNGPRHDPIAAHFGVRMARYYQRLNQILSMPEALAYNPQLIYHLRARRDRSMRERVLNDA